MSRYPIPKSTNRVEITSKNSRFIATIGRAATVADAQQFIRTIRAEMPDATHHVYAYQVGYPPSVTEGMSDDGEPSGTSGPPALAVVRGADVGDVVLVITRYFGGTKLGTGGLVAAYSAAAKAAVAALDTEEKVDRVAVVVSVPYNLHAPTRKLLEGLDVVALTEDFGGEVTLQFKLAIEQWSALEQGINNLTAGRITPRRADGAPAD
jgi:uncharacterized YigZ family protein